jgi:hypothetical protein
MTFYRDRVEFIQGTPVKDSDLDRVSAKVATAFYLLADQLAKVSKTNRLVGSTSVKIHSCTLFETFSSISVFDHCQ